MAGFLDGYFETVLEKDASDIHLAVGQPVEIRVDGEL